MRVLVAANLTPFLRGGAQAHIEGLVAALRQHGHDVECLQLPFAFGPEAELARAMEVAQALDMQAPSGQSIDRVIGLQFPAYAVRHRHAVAWVMHQHRAVYDLYDQLPQTPALAALREKIQRFDQQTLQPLASNGRLFANSGCVAQRLARFNQLQAQVLYHPPPEADRFFCEQAQGFFFFPSRFESLKRQELVIRAAALVQSPVRFVLAGQGGQFQAAQQLVAELGLGDRVRLLGAISSAEKWVWYAKSLAVCYPPFDEDYGYVTLEAMLSSKAVVTCTDSGGPLEFVLSGQTGLVVEPSPQALAEAFDRLAASPAQARAMGEAGHAHYRDRAISWDAVVDRLLGA
jgi:glycosyltransferase involved in cell wall biosynthesis